MKRYATSYPNGAKIETSSADEAFNFRFTQDGQQFFIRGTLVTSTEFFRVVCEARDAAWAKKEQTHKRVKVLHGSSGACYVEKWVRK